MHYLKRMKQFFAKEKYVPAVIFSIYQVTNGERTAIELLVHRESHTHKKRYIHEGPSFLEATNSDTLKFYHFILLHKVQLELTLHSYIPRSPPFC